VSIVFSPDVATLARQRVTIAPYTNDDGFGTPTYGAPVTHRARVTMGAMFKSKTTGEEIVAAGLVRLTRKVAVSTKDKLTLPDGDEVPILWVNDDPDELGRSATGIYFGRSG
jgi:hypothetical protein